MTSILLLAAVLMAPHGSSHGTALPPPASMDPAAAAPSIENGTPAMQATSPANISQALQPANSATATVVSTTSTPEHRRRGKPAHH